MSVEKDSTNCTEPLLFSIFPLGGCVMSEEKLKELLKEKEKQLYEQIKSTLDWLKTLGDKVMIGTENEEQQAILEFLKKTLIVRKEQVYYSKEGKWTTYYEFLLNTKPMVWVTSSSIGTTIGFFTRDYSFAKCEWEWMLPAEAGMLINAVVDYISDLEEPPIP